MRLALGLLLMLTGCPGPVTTVIVVRHAEKAPEPKADPPLTEAGAARAQQLIEELKAHPVAAILSTATARTRATAAPLASKRGLTTEVLDGKPAQVAEAVLARHRGKTVVVVGHSNTAPGIVAALGAPKPKDICDGEFDNLYVVRVPASGAATVDHREYGAPSADESCRTGSMAPP